MQSTSLFIFLFLVLVFNNFFNESGKEKAEQSVAGLSYKAPPNPAKAAALGPKLV